MTVRTITPSSVEDDDVAHPVTPSGDGTALLRGRLLHRLMQSLPDIPPERRIKAATNFLTRAGATLDAAERSSLAGQVMAVLEDPRFAGLFAPGSRAEVPIVGEVQIGSKMIRVPGQVDRLAVTENAVLIGDFKTNRDPPQRIDKVPPGYVRQLALYRAVLEKIYPDRPIRAALIWTEVPDLMELSVEVLDAALAEVTTT
jgi:ATP-dependent helicase/nuclease subunit A